MPALIATETVKISTQNVLKQRHVDNNNSGVLFIGLITFHRVVS